MTTINFHKESALFLLEAHGPEIAEKIAIDYSKKAFLNDDMSKHYHWKFVSDEISQMTLPFKGEQILSQLGKPQSI